jgi:hypothetical protein
MEETVYRASLLRRLMSRKKVEKMTMEEYRAEYEDARNMCIDIESDLDTCRERCGGGVRSPPTLRQAFPVHSSDEMDLERLVYQCKEMDDELDQCKESCHPKKRAAEADDTLMEGMSIDATDGVLTKTELINVLVTLLEVMQGSPKKQLLASAWQKIKLMLDEYDSDGTDRMTPLLQKIKAFQRTLYSQAP